MIKLFSLLTFLCIGTVSNAQDILGKWKTIDDNTGEYKSVVEIFKKGDKYFGKIVALTDESSLNAVCEECDESDDRFSQPILGLEIIRDLEMDGNEFIDGTVLDPENGTVYRCKAWVENGDLMLRGYVAFFFRTQVWKKMEEE